jgi:hypothetical protein
MTQAIQYPLVNGVRHSFTSIELKINGDIYVGFKSINYSRNRGRTMVKGNSPDPLGKTRGENEYKADCELYLAEWNALQAKLGAGYGDVFFDITVTYNENGFDVITDTIKGCTLDTTDASNGQGSDPTVRKFELNPIKILFNGLDDMAVPLTGAQTA